MEFGILIRQATPDDYATIAALHAASWRSAYRGILSDSFLGESLDDERRNYWKTKAANLTPNEFALIAEKDGLPVGFIAVLDKPEQGYAAFIDNLHVTAHLKGKGIGGKLMKAAAEKLKQSGRNSVYLWVLKGNEAAEKFYLAKGASIADESTINFGGKMVGQKRFVWPSLEPLLGIGH